MQLRNFCARLTLWGSGPLAFVSGILLSIALNIITGLSLYTPTQWPENGYFLLLGSLSFAVCAGSMALLSWRIQPFKSRADVQLEERRRYLRPDEQHRGDEEFVWDEVLNADGMGSKHQKALVYPLFFAVTLFVLGSSFFVITLPVF